MFISFISVVKCDLPFLFIAEMPKTPGRRSPRKRELDMLSGNIVAGKRQRTAVETYGEFLLSLHKLPTLADSLSSLQGQVSFYFLDLVFFSQTVLCSVEMEKSDQAQTALNITWWMLQNIPNKCQ